MEEEVTLEKFTEALQKRKEKRKHKIKNSWGEYDYYKWLRKRGWRDIGNLLTEKDFYILMSDIFSQISDKIAAGESLKLPYRMGVIELGKKNGTLKVRDGKLYTNYQIDWQKTIKLWYEDKEAMQKKQLIRIVEKAIFKIGYFKKLTPFLALFPSRALKQKVKKAVQNNEIDAFELQKYK